MFDMRVESSGSGEYTVTTEDGRPIRSGQTRYWAKAVFRAHYLRDIRAKLDAEFERLADEADRVREEGKS